MEHLEAELKKRGWSKNQLANRAGLSNSYFSMIANGSRGIGADACRKIARAMNIDVEVVYGWAGLLSQNTESGDWITNEIANIAAVLPEDDRQTILALARNLVERRTKRADAKT